MLYMKTAIKSLLFFGAKILTPLLSNDSYTKLLFRFNCWRTRRPYYRLDLKKPKTFNEKVSFIKFNQRHPLATIVADKYRVREFVSERIGEQYLIPLLAMFDSPNKLTLAGIEGDFIIKMNTGSGNNIIVKDGQTVNIEAIKRSFQKYFNTDTFISSREWHYKQMPPRILVEKLLGDNIVDYKFFCNKNGPFAIQIDVDRYIDHKRNIYDVDWNLLPIKIRYENSEKRIEKPKKLEQMLAIAKKLSEGFTFSRIDLYELDGRIWFGEITMHPGGGAEPFDSRESDVLLGRYIDLENCS